MGDFKAFGVQKHERRPKYDVIEGTVEVTGRTYYYDLFFYLFVSPGLIKLNTSRDFDGERLIEYFCTQLGPSSGPPRIEIGGRMDEEESAFLCVDWRFAAGEFNDWKHRLNLCLKQEIL